MKGTLSLTRIRPQTYSIRGAGRPTFPPHVSHYLYCTYSVRDSARNSTPYFCPCLRSVTAVDFPAGKVTACTSVHILPTPSFVSDITRL
jgi:hypothetical protein